ncbi:hypothetical protein C2S52_002399 [Perilla frutescens var. hirtella]|nr:hypothetical protein C2S51_013011 [Perilla frutescens var. frutescens]KAH6791922.1 hypothetical protein C2S52_002399 [Perilla frutescens var. hirtella]
MKKNNINLEAFIRLTAAIALTLIIFLSTNVEKGECLSTDIGSYLEKASCLSGNASACNTDETAEYVMDEFEISRRILANGKSQIVYKSFNKNAPFCNAKIIANCIGPDGKFYKKRDCGYKELCRPH